MRQRTVSISDETWRELGREADRRGVSRSELIREELSRFLGRTNADCALELRVTRIERHLDLPEIGDGRGAAPARRRTP